MSNRYSYYGGHLNNTRVRSTNWDLRCIRVCTKIQNTQMLHFQVTHSWQNIQIIKETDLQATEQHNIITKWKI